MNNANILDNLDEMAKFLETNYRNLMKNRKSEYPVIRKTFHKENLRTRWHH